MSDAYTTFTFAPDPLAGHVMDNDERRNFRTTLSHYPTGVAVVTALGEGGARIGLTVNSFISLSLHPPLILWGVNCRAPSAAAFTPGKRFVVNLLAAHQESVAQNFARSSSDKFAGIEYVEGEAGVPILSHTLGWLETRVETVHRSGDHNLIIGEVDRFAHVTEGEPLVYHRGRYKTFGE